MNHSDTMNGAESLVHSLLASGVDTCFSNPGTSEMHFVAALDHIPGMRCVLALHENVATGAADGYFRMARKPACTLLHLGPGLANGLSNLHNAKKAGSGVVNVVGDHATTHLALDAPLTSDIQGIARPVSHWLRSTATSADVGADASQAVQAAMTANGQIATLILPSDTAWNPGGVAQACLPVPTLQMHDDSLLDLAVEALSESDSLLYLGAGCFTKDNLDRVGRIAAKTGCALLSEWTNARMERGAGQVIVNRLPYPVDQAVEVLRPFKRIVMVGARAPVGFFAYPDKPSILTQPGAELLSLATAEADLDAALSALCEATGAVKTSPAYVAQASLPDRPNGPITPESLAAVVARAIPENSIVVDESVTSGRGLFPVTAGAPPHTWLNNRGGSIGYSMPASIGAAIACPDRKVLTLTGDGSAMYALPSLWTMAREALDITVVVLSNRSYQILRGELTNVGVRNPGPRAIDMLSLDRPALDWTQMANGMGVDACRVSTCAELEAALSTGLASPHPYLIEAMM
jgi:acetolactate synthase-1/2/3 large subunit